MRSSTGVIDTKRTPDSTLSTCRRKRLLRLSPIFPLASGVPFGRAVMMDVMSGVSAAIVIYLAIVGTTAIILGW